MIENRRIPQGFLVGLVAVALLLAVGLAAVASRPVSYDFPLARKVQKTLEDDPETTSPVADVDGVQEATEVPLPRRVRIEVPFLVQAPTGNWDMPYQEACEEVSMLMVHHSLDGSPIPKGAVAESAIVDLVEWESSQLALGADITMEEAKRVAEEYWQHQARLFHDFTIDDMKHLLAKGHPLIVPLAGRDIGNPYFSGDGPWYHMLVITGYDGNQFITNDPGTRRGEGYRYPQQRLYDAIHDWTGKKENIRQGRKVLMVLQK